MSDACNVPGTGAPKEDTAGGVAAAAVYNHGYDDSRGDYYLTKHDHINYRYEILSLLGKGSFGQVVKCFDHKTKCNVALKIIRNKKRFERQGAVEVKVLERLKDEIARGGGDSSVQMVESFLFRGHLCITFELLGANLYEWLKAGGFRGVHLGVIRRFTVQMLQCLELLSRAGIVHCDLKPENVLLKDPAVIEPSTTDFDPFNPRYEIKVIDFGSSCFENEKVYTYVQSRFYRSPEVILGISYSASIDMWSLGCILCELYTGYPLFPGENEAEQLLCIMEILGVPDMALVDRGNRRKMFFEPNGTPRAVTNSKGRRRRVGSKCLDIVLKGADKGFVDFVARCLEWDPKRRIGPAEALRHEWV
ncbi:kinase-like domain-containing protein, partial [Geranomyces variabilis]